MSCKNYGNEDCPKVLCPDYAKCNFVMTGSPENPLDGVVSLQTDSTEEECSPVEKVSQYQIEVVWLRNRMQQLSKIHPAKYKHCCYEWDGLEIDEYDPEFEACTCFDELQAG